MEAIRGAIAELAARRESAAAAAGAAMVNQAQVQQALHQQHRELARARAQLASAIDLARRVADETAREDGEPAADPYRRNVEGLLAQVQVLDVASKQIDELGDVSGTQVSAARLVLARSRGTFDAALREQLTLLVALERLERVRLILATRAAARGRDE